MFDDPTLESTFPEPTSGAGATPIRQAHIAPAAIERPEGFHLPAAGAALVRVGVAASRSNTHARVKESVIAVVLADHQRRVLSERPVSMMHHGARRQRMSERSFCSRPMDIFCVRRAIAIDDFL